MSVLDRLAEWREADFWDSPPTEEEVLRQMVFSAITGFLDETVHIDSDELGNQISDWLDGWAERGKVLIA